MLAGVGNGVGLRLAATGLFAVMSLFVRLASFDAPVGQIVFWRSSVALVPIVLYMVWRREAPAALDKTPAAMGHPAQRRVNENFVWQNSAELALTLLPKKGKANG